MKKIISVFLAALMLLSLCCTGASAEEDTLIITVANDLHYNTTYTSRATKRNSLNEDFHHVGTSMRLPNEAYAIIKAFLEDAASDESQIIIMPGDMTDNGSEEEVAVITALFAEFEDTTGKEIYVVPGNHDLFESSLEKFKKDYARFGYDEATEIDPDSGSYTVDLPDDYRLIAIDSCVAGESIHGINEARLNWIKEQGEKAKAEGKKLIGMQHHNFLEHMVLSSAFQAKSLVTANTENAAEIYADAGIKYIFTGHTHDHDISSYTTDDGKVIYDAVTGAVNSLGSFYRVVSFGENVTIETRGVDEIDVSLLPEGITDNAIALAESNFYEYQTIATNLSYEIIFNYYTTARGLKSLLKLEDEEMNTIIDKVGDRLNEALNMPLLKVNEAEEGKSIEAIVEKYDTVIPETDYENIIDLAVTLYQAHNLGDEYFPPYSDELIIITRGLAAAVNYALSEVSAEEYATVLSFVAELFDVSVPVDFLSYTGSAIKRFEGVEILITTAALPLFADFAADKAPGDCNVTLPGYSEIVEEEMSFFEKIFNFFKTLFDTFLTVFALSPSDLFKF